MNEKINEKGNSDVVTISEIRKMVNAGYGFVKYYDRIKRFLLNGYIGVNDVEFALGKFMLDADFKPLFNIQWSLDVNNRIKPLSADDIKFNEISFFHKALSNIGYTCSVISCEAYIEYVKAKYDTKLVCKDCDENLKDITNENSIFLLYIAGFHGNHAKRESDNIEEYKELPVIACKHHVIINEIEDITDYIQDRLDRLNMLLENNAKLIGYTEKMGYAVRYEYDEDLHFICTLCGIRNIFVLNCDESWQMLYVRTPKGAVACECTSLICERHSVPIIYNKTYSNRIYVRILDECLVKNKQGNMGTVEKYLAENNIELKIESVPFRKLPITIQRDIEFKDITESIFVRLTNGLDMNYYYAIRRAVTMNRMQIVALKERYEFKVRETVIKTIHKYYTFMGYSKANATDIYQQAVVTERYQKNQRNNLSLAKGKLKLVNEIEDSERISGWMFAQTDDDYIGDY